MIMSWRGRKRRDIAPPPPPAGGDADIAVRMAAARAGEAQRQLRDAQAREPGVRAREAAARRQLARNGLAELFDEALRANGGMAT